MTPLHLFHFVPGVPPRPWSPLYFFLGGGEGDGGTSHRKAALTGFPRISGSGRPNSFAPGSGAAAQHQSGRRGVDRGGFRVTLRAQLEMDDRIHIVGGCYPSSHFAMACPGTYGRYLEDQFPQDIKYHVSEREGIHPWQNFVNGCTEQKTWACPNRTLCIFSVYSPSRSSRTWLIVSFERDPPVGSMLVDKGVPRRKSAIVFARVFDFNLQRLKSKQL